jgi:hypothetical protein
MVVTEGLYGHHWRPLWSSLEVSITNGIEACPLMVTSKGRIGCLTA